MSKIHSLLKQTAIYGVSSILVRMLNWAVSPYLSRMISEVSMGIIADILAMTAMLNILYMVGMETSYFRFSKDHPQKAVFRSTFFIVFCVSSVSSLLLFIFSEPIALWLRYPGMGIYIRILSGILFFDNVINIPLSKLRQDGLAKFFVATRIFNVMTFIFFNILFFQILHKPTITILGVTTHDEAVLALLANLIASLLSCMLFVPKIYKSIGKPDFDLIKKMLSYSLPLLVVGIAAMINETMDRPMLKYWYQGSTQEALRQVGIYSTNYKLAIFMTLVIQAFRMGAEPFFFKESKNDDAPKTYAMIMDYFVLACCGIYVLASVNLNLLSMINDAKYKEGIMVVPILLLANLFLGIYYNASIWYKVVDKTKAAAYISIFGALVTILLNYLLIPRYSFMGCAVATLICYASMTVVSLFWGAKEYKIPYRFTTNTSLILISIIVVSICNRYTYDNIVVTIFVSVMYLVFLYLLFGKYQAFYRKK